VTASRFLVGAATALATAGAACGLASVAAPAAAPPINANPCLQVKNCMSTAGPWVAVPARGEADFLLECPKRSGTIGGIDVLSDSPDVRVTWQANPGSPVRPGTSTAFFAYFQAVSATGKPGLFQPYIGCISQQQVKSRVTVSARIPQITRPGLFLDRRQKTLYTIKAGKTLAASEACGKHERLLSGWYAVVFGSVKAPDAGLGAKVHVTLALARGKVVATAQTDAGVPASASPGLQVGALCAA
jgi:hypothetical protein